MIESVQNQQVKQVRRLQSSRKERYASSLFVVEGSRWLREFEREQALLTAVYYTKEWQETANNRQLLNTFSTLTTQVSSAVMRAMSDTETPAGILGIAKMPQNNLPSTPTFYLILDSISDPGNMGSLIRTAAAANVDAILLSPNCVDVYNPKVVRSSMGGILKLPILQKSWYEIQNIAAELSIFALDTGGNIFYTDVNWLEKTALLVGNEGHGLSAEGLNLAKKIITIPMNPAVESLNASMAAGIVLFEAVRQKNLASFGL